MIDMDTIGYFQFMQEQEELEQQKKDNEAAASGFYQVNYDGLLVSRYATKNNN